MSSKFRSALTGPTQGFAFRSGLSAWLAKRKRARSIIMLHGIGGPDMMAGDFRALVRWLSSTFRVVTVSHLVRDLRQGEVPAAEGEVAITFDDGLRNQYELAYPVLREFNAPATMFVCPQLVEDGRWIWNMETRARLSRLQPDRVRALAMALGINAKTPECIVHWMKSLPLEQRQRAEQQIAEETSDFVPSLDEIRANAPMSWDEMLKMDPGVVTIGSHTCTHPILPTLDESAIHRELKGSRDMLERRLQRRVDLFCYPNGSEDARVRRVASEIYDAALSTVEGVVQPGQDLYRLHRVPVTNNLALMAWRMHRPWA